jgi:hypothetical protein
VLQGDKPVLSAGDAVRLAGQGGEDRLGGLERRFGVAPPLLVAQRSAEALPGRGLGECPTATPHRELALRVAVLQPSKGEAPEAAREDPARQAEVGTTRDPLGPVGRQAPRGQDPGQMGVMVAWLAPGVQPREAPHLRPEMLGVPSAILERLRHGPTEQAVECPGVLQRQRPEVVREGKDHMAVGGLEEFLLTGGEPRGLRRAMTCGAAAVPARVVRLDLVPTGVARGAMAPERRRPAHRSGAQGAVLRA